MPFKFTCPKCHHQNPLTDDHQSEEVLCADCGSRFRVRRPKQESRPAPPPVEPPAPEVAPAPGDSIRILWGIGDRILDVYEVTGLVGDDAYGQAYRVYHHGWMLDVNVKTPSPEILGRTVAKESLMKDAEAWASLGVHPNLVACYYVRVLGGAPRIFSQWVDGQPLTELINGGRLYEGSPRHGLERVLDIGIQVARALGHAHGQGQTHGAVGAEDVLVEADFTTRVTHFCLIRTLEQARRSRRISKRNLGKQAPEQSAGQKSDPRTDIWLFALLLADMVLGDPAWKDDTPEGTPLPEWMGERLELTARTLVPARLRRLLEQCVEGDPQDRPRQIDQVRSELQAIYEEVYGHEYLRPEVEADVLVALSMSNRGLALWDKGEKEPAEGLFDEAMSHDPECAAAIYNHCLVLWRTGRMSYEGLLNQLEAVPESWKQYLLQGQVAAEKKDPRAARWLQKAAKEVPAGTADAARLDKLQQMLADSKDVEAPMAVAAAPVVKRREVTPERPPAHAIEDRILEIQRAGQQGRWKEAAEHLLEAARLPGGSEDATLRAFTRIIARHQPRQEASQAVLRYRLVGHEAAVQDVAVALDGDLAVSASDDRTIKVWDLKTGQEVRTLTGHEDAVVAVAVTPDGQTAASCSLDKTVRTWNVPEGTHLRTMEHDDQVNDLAMTPDGRMILSCSHDKTVRVWNASTGRCLQTLEGHEGPIMGVAVSADGRIAASVGLDKSLRIWDLATSTSTQVLAGHQEAAWGLALTPEGARLAAGSEHNLRVWDTVVGKQVQVLHGHTDSATDVAITTDARFVVSGSLDRTVRIWDIGTGQCQLKFAHHGDGIRAVAISMDGRRVLSASFDTSIEVWEIDWTVRAHEVTGWDAAALPALSTALQTRLKRRAGRRAAVSGEEFERLLADLSASGFGWVQAAAIKDQIEKMLGVTVAWWEPSAELKAAQESELALFKAGATLPAEPPVPPPPPPPPPPRAAAPPPPRPAAAAPAAPEVAPLAVAAAVALEPEPVAEEEVAEEVVIEPEPDPQPVAAPKPLAAVVDNPLPSGPDLSLEPPLMLEPLGTLAPDLSAPLLLGPDGEPDLSPSPLGLASTPALLTPQALPTLDLGLLPPPPVLGPPPGLAVKTAEPKAKAEPAARSKAEPKQPEPKTQVESKPDMETGNGVAQVVAEPPAPPPAAPPAEDDAEAKLGPIRRAELEAARRRAKAAAQVAEVLAPAPAPEAGTDDQKPQLKPRKTIFTSAESLLKMAKPEPVAPALAGVPEVTLKMRRQEDVWEVGDLLLDLYQVTQFLGEGTMGKVYQVLHPGWNLQLAMRTPRAAIHANEAALERWLAEAQKWADLGTHPHVATCHYARTAHDIPRIFMEHLEGGTLGSWIHSGKLYDGGHERAMARMLDVVIQVARGLAYAHNKGLIHQDVKPANVMMTADGTAKLTDFGLGRSWDGTLDEEALPPGRELLTNIGGMTPAYASPEQFAKQPLSFATDVWSWGLLVLEMFAGEVTWTNGKAASKALSDYALYGADADIPPMPESLSKLLERVFKDRPDVRPDFKALLQELPTLYQELTRSDYPRVEAEADVLQAAATNNKALAAADMGFPAQMDELFDEALRVNEHSAQAIFNRGLSSWRSGKITFEALTEALHGSSPSPGNGWEIGYLQAWLHIERGEEQEARRLLTQAHREAFNDPDGDQAIARAGNLARAYNANMSVLTAHGSPAWAVDLTDDNAFAISASDDSTLRVWDVSTGRCIRLLEGHTAAVFSVALTPEGHVAISGGEDMTVRVWNVGIGEAVHILEGHEDSVTGVVSSAKGKSGASCSMDGTVRLWDIESGYCTKTLKSESGASFTALAASGDLREILAAEEGGDILVWDASAGTVRLTLKGHEEKVEALAMTREGTLAVSASDDGTLRIWDLRNGHTVHVLEGHHGWVNGVALTPDGSLCISAGWDKTLRVWDVSTGRCLYTLTGHENHVRGVALNPEGTQAVSVTIDGAMGFWKLPEELAEAPRTLIRARASGHRDADMEKFVEAIEHADTLSQEAQWQAATASLNEGRSLPGYEFSPVAVALTDVLALHAGRGRLRGVWTSDILEARHRTMRWVTVSGNGRLAVTANGNGSLHVWDRASAKLVRDVKGHDGAVQAVAVTHDGVTAFSAGADQTVRVWNLPRGECEAVWRGHTSGVWCVAVTPDGSMVVSGGWDDTLRVWSGGKAIKVLKGHDGPVLAVAISPDGRMVVSGSSDNTVRVWDVASGRCMRTMEGHDDLISTVCFMGDGSQVLSGSNDRSLRVWDVETGKSVMSLTGHRQPVCTAAVSLDCKTVVSGSWDWTVRVWELPSGRCLRILDGHLGAVRGVALDFDGRHGMSVSEDGTLRQWLFDWALEPRAEADWEDGARIFLTTFAATLRRRSGSKVMRWSSSDMDDLMHTLAQNGYGWLRRGGVEAELQRMVAAVEQQKS